MAMRGPNSCAGSEIREADFALKLAYPQVRTALEESGLGTFERLVTQYFTNRAAIERYLGANGPMLRDDRPVTEYFLSLPTDSKPVDLTPYAGAPAEIIGDR